MKAYISDTLIRNEAERQTIHLKLSPEGFEPRLENEEVACSTSRAPIKLKSKTALGWFLCTSTEAHLFFMTLKPLLGNIWGSELVSCAVEGAEAGEFRRGEIQAYRKADINT